MMFGLGCKRLQLHLQLLPNYRYAEFSTTHSHFFSNTTYFSRSFSSRTSLAAVGESDTVSFLKNSCNLSPETAESVSKKVKFQSLERPESVLNFLRDHGFTNTHISRVVSSYPRMLLSDAEKTLLPKFEFFYSIGCSRDDLTLIVSRNPIFAHCGLNNKLIPLYNFLKSVFFSDEKVVAAFKCKTWFFAPNVQKNMSTNTSVLKGLGVPQRYILGLVTSFLPRISAEKFEEHVKKILKMGFSPSKFTFVEALRATCQMNESTWEHKIEIYKRWGWSQAEILSAFRKQPSCMTSSEKNIMGTMDFLVNKMGWTSSDVAKVPTVLCYSLEKRIIPRCSVLRILQLKGLINGKPLLSPVVMLPEKCFLDRYVIKHQDHVPQLLDIFQANISLFELGLGFEEFYGVEKVVT